jgi:peptidoglycan hydrolase-like protein with peptidoglycan-binding domain
MSDDIKKFINLTNLYTEVTEVDLESKQLDEKGWIQRVGELFGIGDKEAEDLNARAEELGSEVAAIAPTTVTTQAQANSILQNPDATDAQRKAAQDFYDENSGPEARGPTTRPNNRPADAVAGKNDQGGAAGTGNVVPRPTNSDDVSGQGDWDIKYGETHNPDGTPKAPAATAPSAEPTSRLDTKGETPAATAPSAEPTSRLDTKGETPAATAPSAEPTSRLDTKGETPAATADPEEVEPEVKVEPAASNGSLLGRKLDLTTPNIMKAYNDGGKQAMPTIKNMQTALSRLGFDPNGLDGKYGNGTFKAVQEFQKANGLAVDGQAGPSTMAAIKKALDDNFDTNKVTPADSAQAAAPTVQTASKDNNMNKNKINEASMNISMNGNDASEVADLVKLLQNAGMPQAGPVSDIPMPKALPTPHDHDSHDNMKSMMTLMSEPEDAPCGDDCGCESCATEDTSEYDAVVSEWDNSPEEEYGDISAVIPDGDDLHKSKKPYPAVDGGDNAMALESIKETLWAALQEKATTEGRGRGKKMKLKASRGNEDIKTTEGSRGKKSRGKKSRG